MAICNAALSTGGPILEVAAGPGGGNLSPILHIDPHIPVIVNDIEPRILALCRDHLAEAVPGNNVIPAAFDAAASLLRNDSVPCVSSCGGLSSIKGDKGSAISEAFRALEPGGCLVALEMSFTEETLRNLPASLRSDWRDDPSIASNGWPAALEERGFQVIRDTVTEGRQLHADESGKAAEASKYGATLRVEYHHIVARKPVLERRS